MYDIAIIGGGPAGASAAIFTSKAGQKTILFDHDKSITKRAWIENHYGAPDIEGPELIKIGQQQAEKHGTKLVKAEVTQISKQGDTFLLEADGEKYEAKFIILATGVSTSLADQLGLKTKEGRESRIQTVFDVDADGKTNVDGVWAAGTAANVSVHTIITAGDGAKVAINLLSEIKGERHVDHDLLKK